MLEDIEYEIKGLFHKVVNFECPKCNVPLSTDLKDAGNKDECPHCGNEFISPGSKELGKSSTKLASSQPNENIPTAKSVPEEKYFCARCNIPLTTEKKSFDGKEYCKDCYATLAPPTPVITVGLPEKAARSVPIICGNCDRSIGRLETTYDFKGSTVCQQCDAILSQPLPAGSSQTLSPIPFIPKPSDISFEEKAKFAAKENAKAIEHRIAIFFLVVILISFVPVLLKSCSD